MLSTFIFNLSMGMVHDCRNLPFDGRARQEKMGIFQKGKRVGVATNVYSRKTLGKPKKRSADFENKGSRVVYA